jgi:hypothetical protein
MNGSLLPQQMAVDILRGTGNPVLVASLSQ